MTGEVVGSETSFVEANNTANPNDTLAQLVRIAMRLREPHTMTWPELCFQRLHRWMRDNGGMARRYGECKSEDHTDKDALHVAIVITPGHAQMSLPTVTATTAAPLGLSVCRRPTPHG
ncbi:hypothetical protein GCM10022248_45040 [Nonomuraea soli]